MSKNKKMELVIQDDRTIKTVQEEFNLRFPYLKLEFFAKPHTRGCGSSKKIMKSSTKTLKECSTLHKKGHISILPTHTVAELEETFRDRFGLHVQVFRKSGKVWLETTATDGWSLEKQNEQGEALSKFNLNHEKELMED